MSEAGKVWLERLQLIMSLRKTLLASPCGTLHCAVTRGDKGSRQKMALLIVFGQTSGVVVEGA